MQNFEQSLRKKLKTIDCKIRPSGSKGNDFEIVSPENDHFWLYWHSLPKWQLFWRPWGRSRCVKAQEWERKIREAIENVVSC